MRKIAAAGGGFQFFHISSFASRFGHYLFSHLEHPVFRFLVSVVAFCFLFLSSFLADILYLLCLSYAARPLYFTWQSVLK